MSLFIVVLEEPMEAADEEEVSGSEEIDVRRIDSTVFLVSGDCLTTQIAKIFKVYTPQEDGNKEGLILELSGNRAGFHPSSTWEWFARAEKQSALRG